MIKTLNVELGDRAYPIHIGSKLLGDSSFILPHLKKKQVVVVSNTTVAPLYLLVLKNSLMQAGVKVSELVLPDGEKFKTSETLNSIYDFLLQNKIERNVTIIALGGGVVGDMAGYAAATYQRGIPFIQIPTTLLSQVDSSVGGKTGINHPLGKNMIGAFYQPQVVIADIDTLKTLPRRELSAGMAEVIKYGLIRDFSFYNWIEKNIEKIMALEKDFVTESIYRSCQNKAEVVAADEKESGERALLNLGHTFGHAIENAMGYGVWLHGEAVAAGTMMAANLSNKLNWLTGDDVVRTERLLNKAGLPTKPPKLGVDKYLELMSLDKKVQDGKLRLVLQKKIGEALITSDYPLESLREVLSCDE